MPTFISGSSTLLQFTNSYGDIPHSVLLTQQAEISTVASKPGLYHHVVSNTEGVDFDVESNTGVYYQLKEAISTLR